jgi:cell division protein FtsI/penicillin-binding protein 2
MARKKALTQALVHAMQIRRLCFFAGCLITGFVALGYRLVDLQVAQHEWLSDEARNNTERTYVRPPKRGDIRDIRGNLLATSKIVHDVCADPEVLGTNYMAVASQLAPILEMPLAEVAEKLQPRFRVNDSGQKTPVRWVQLKKRLEPEEWDKVAAAMNDLSFGVDEKQLKLTKKAYYNRIRHRGVFDEPEEIRFYPNQRLASHVLGYLGSTEKTNSNGHVDTITTGKDGIEAFFNKPLTGVEGWRQTETDSRQRELVLFRDQDVAPRPGLTAILTLDAGVQHIVEDEIAAAAAKHDPTSISCVVVRPKTGEILAMATLPNYDPNCPGASAEEDRRNRAISDLAEPGSTFKIVVVSGALNEGVVELNDPIDCENGLFHFMGKPLHDDHPAGIITVERVIAKSSNIGAAKIGIKLGKEKLYHYVRAFGFGQETGITLPGEVRGITHPVNRWNGLSISRIPMGHEVACTPLQTAMAMAAIANRGVLMRPILVDSFVDEDGKQVAKCQPQAVRRVISEAAAEKMVTALKTVVSTNGTGTKAMLAYYTAAGKTGTAQKLINGHYVRNHHYSSFAGFFPADNPELCILVVLDDPRKGYYGSETGAPVFQRIAERAANYLAIPPEHLPAGTLASVNAPAHGASNQIKGGAL